MGLVPKNAALGPGISGLFGGAPAKSRLTPEGERRYLQSLLPKTPDLTDEAVQEALRSSRLQTGMNRKSTFITSTSKSAY
jgi:hypothetical protein